MSLKFKGWGLGFACVRVCECVRVCVCVSPPTVAAEKLLFKPREKEHYSPCMCHGLPLTRTDITELVRRNLPEKAKIQHFVSH